MVLLMHEIVRHFLACTGLTSTSVLFSSGAGAGAFFALAFFFLGLLLLLLRKQSLYIVVCLFGTFLGHFLLAWWEKEVEELVLKDSGAAATPPP